MSLLAQGEEKKTGPESPQEKFHAIHYGVDAVTDLIIVWGGDMPD